MHCPEFVAQCAVAYAQEWANSGVGLACAQAAFAQE